MFQTHSDPQESSNQDQHNDPERHEGDAVNMGFVNNPHDHDHDAQDGHETGKSSETWDQVEVHLFANQDKGGQHGYDWKDLCIDVGIHDRPTFKQEKIDTKGDGKNARNGDQVDEDRIKVFPGR